jgi:hypothetical protein
MRDREKVLAERHEIRAKYGTLFDEIAAILFELDPVGINFENNTGEYKPEAGMILPRLRSCRRPQEMLAVSSTRSSCAGSTQTGPESNY